MYLSYDGLFFRVFCVTLIALAFTFTAILTNVFIDIDGILAKKAKDQTHVKLEGNIKNEISFENKLLENKKIEVLQEEPQQESFYNEEQNILDDFENSGYRTKRSSENQNFLLRLQNPELKNMLTKRLATLLEEMDNDDKTTVTTTTKLQETPTSTFNKDEEKNHPDNQSQQYDNEDSNLLHLAMHNILLQGIIKNMDVNQFYKKVNKIVETINPVVINNKNQENKANRKSFNEVKTAWDAEIFMRKFKKELVKDTKPDDNKAFNQQCQVNNNSSINEAPQLFIKASIDIISNKYGLSKQTIPNVTGDIKLSFNGKAVTMKQAGDDNNKNNNTILNSGNENNQTTPGRDLNFVVDLNSDVTTLKSFEPIDVNEIIKKNNFKTNNYLTKLVSQYIKDYEKTSSKDNSGNAQNNEKRTKRDIKKKKRMKHPETEDDLIIEIETHFDPNGLKGERKKKIIKSIISKIQKAIKPDIQALKNVSKSKFINLHIKKRNQNSVLKLFDLTSTKNKVDGSADVTVSRQLHPIDKIIEIRDDAPLVYGKTGEGWKMLFTGPGFLTPSKSINSAESAKVDVDYKRVIKSNGIPQRYQIPIYADASTDYENVGFDVDNLEHFLTNRFNSPLSRDITDRTLNGVQLRTYAELPKEIPQNSNEVFTKKNHSLKHYVRKRNANSKKGILFKRSTNINKHNYHSNEYKIIFNNNFLPFQNYEDVLERGRGFRMINENKITRPNLGDLLFLDDNDILTKNLNPSDIFGLADYLDRNVRSVNINSKKKVVMNTFVNTHPKHTRKIFINGKQRLKRGIDKIRIIASDDISEVEKHPSENIFIVADENVFANNENTKQLHESAEEKPNDEHFGIFSRYPFKYSPPQIQSSVLRNLFQEKTRNNALMSKYPHVFVDEQPKSNEEIERQAKGGFEKPLQDTENITEVTNDYSIPDSKYRISMSVPKNESEEAGFKAIHTTFHKSYNKNGLQYFQTLNLTEISNVENDTNHLKHLSVFQSTNTPLVNQIKRQQEKIKQMIKSHKDNIDLTLASLKSEKKNIENAFNITTITNKPIERQHNINKDDVIKIVSDIIEQKRSLEVDEKTTNPTAANLIKVDKSFTKAILDRLDTNNDILKRFLAIITNQNQIFLHDKGDKVVNKTKRFITKTSIPKYVLNLSYPNKTEDLKDKQNSTSENQNYSKNVSRNIKNSASANNHFFLSPIEYDVSLLKNNPDSQNTHVTEINIVPKKN